jgi:membrane protein
MNDRARTPYWLIGLAAILVSTGILRPRGEQGSQRPAEREAMSLKLAREGGKGASQDVGRGRDADSPLEVPAKGWKDIIVRIYRGIGEDRILAIAAGVTFYVLLAIFPGMAGLVSLYSLFADPTTIAAHLNSVAGILPEGGVQIIREQLESLTSQPAPKLGLAMLVSLAIALWSANGGIKAIFDALNIVYGEKEKRGFIRLNAISLAFTLGAMVFVVMAVAAITLLPLAVSYLGLSRVSGLILTIGRWPLLLLCVSLAIALIYRFGPSREKPQWRWITPGSVFAAVAWLVVSLLFSWYAQHFGSYNKTYGSLGAAIGFMTWLWISTIVILIGAKLNAETEHQTSRDTTDGRPRPLGERGARMADSVGGRAG